MKLISIQQNIRKGLRKNKKGGIEGLPLQLMIIIIVATLATSVLIGWMGNIDTPNSIKEVTVDSGDATIRTSTISSIFGSSSTDQYIKDEISITVIDQDGNPLEGATVVLTGLGITDKSGNTIHGTTDDNGNVTFKNAKVKMTGTVGYINVLVSKAGYGEDNSCKITVIA